jgi:hypothetical protein
LIAAITVKALASTAQVVWKEEHFDEHPQDPDTQWRVPRVRDRLEHRARIRADHGKPWNNWKHWDHGNWFHDVDQFNQFNQFDESNQFNQVDQYHESVVDHDTGCQLQADVVGRLVGLITLITLITIDWRVIVVWCVRAA